MHQSLLMLILSGVVGSIGCAAHGQPITALSGGPCAPYPSFEVEGAQIVIFPSGSGLLRGIDRSISRSTGLRHRRTFSELNQSFGLVPPYTYPIEFLRFRAMLGSIRASSMVARSCCLSNSSATPKGFRTGNASPWWWMMEAMPTFILR